MEARQNNRSHTDHFGKKEEETFFFGTRPNWFDAYFVLLAQLGSIHMWILRLQHQCFSADDFFFESPPWSWLPMTPSFTPPQTTELV